MREAVLRYHIEHPVVNDADHRIWNAYGVNSWPTFWLIDPEGNIVEISQGFTDQENPPDLPPA